MANREAKLALLVPLVAKPDRLDCVAQFLEAGYDVVQAESDTIQWFGIKFTSPANNTFAIFDTFPTEHGRSAHLTGQVATALMQSAPQLLSEGPQIGQAAVLASKVHGGQGKTAGLGVGLRVLITAKPDKVDAVRDFLVSAKPLVAAEPFTPVWYAIEFPGTANFAIVDFFADDAGRDKHLGGKVAEALFANVEELLVGPPDVAWFEVLAAKVLA